MKSLVLPVHRWTFLAAWMLCCGLYSCKSRQVEQSPVSEVKPQAPARPSWLDANPCKKRELLLLQEETFPFSEADRIEILSFIPYVKQNLGLQGEKPIEKARLSSIKDGKFDVGYIQERQEISSLQREALFEILFNQISSDPDAKVYTHCYNPHQVIVFYKGEEAIEFFEICLRCMQYNKLHTELDFCVNKWELLRGYFEQVGISYGLDK